MVLSEKTLQPKSPRKQDSTTTHTKPLPTGSLEAQNAAAQVTPARISRILVSRGPLAIRFITQSLSDEIPHFKELSTSKQRRLIMTAMERGDEASSIIFEKLGWGLWGAKRVTPESFESEREVMNKLNAKVKDNASNRNEKSKERRLSGGGPVIKTSPPPVMYIDENVLQTDEDDEYDENDDMRKQGGSSKHQNKYNSGGNNTNSTMYVYTGSGRRRPSAVVYDTTNDPELANERELLAQKVRSAHKSTQASSLRRLSVGSPHPSVNESIASSSYSNQSSRDNVWDIDGHDKSNTASTSSTTTNNTTTLNERLSRRSSRLSVSKESGIRSTLSPLRNRKLVYRMDNNTNNTNSSSNTSNSNFRIDQELDPPHVYSGGGSSSAIASDTDEEDWARIGAASLLRSRSGSMSMSVSVSPGIPPTAPTAAAATAAVNNVGTADATVKSRSMSWTQTEPARAVVQQQLQLQQQQQQPPPPLLLQPPLKSPFTSNSDDDTNETARLLLSLK